MIGSDIHLIHVFLVIFISATCTVGLKMYLPRSEVYGMIGSNETRIYFESCDQSQVRHACTLATDDSYSQEPSQCALSSLEEEPYWEGTLEVPAYITKVSVLNRDHSFRAFQDALSYMAVEVAGITCAEYRSETVFDKRLFPCDVVGSRVMIKSRLRNAELGLCEVDVLGVPLNFPKILGLPGPLKLSSCRMTHNEQCLAGVDNQINTCASTSRSQEGKAFFVINIAPPSIITEIHLSTGTPATLTINIDDRLCIKLENRTNSDISTPLTCTVNTHFGSVVQIINDNDGALTVCEVELYGYASEWKEPEKMKLLGCYKNDPKDLDLPQLVSSIRMSVKKCFKLCKRAGMKYFALQDGRHCFCGSSYGKHGVAGNSTQCNASCEGDEDQKCGGHGTLSSIFEII